jgi:hypothetical protein
MMIMMMLEVTGGWQTVANTEYTVSLTNQNAVLIVVHNFTLTVQI